MIKLYINMSKTLCVVTVATGGCLVKGNAYYNIQPFDTSYIRASVVSQIRSYYGEKTSIQEFDSTFSVEQTRERLTEEFESTFTEDNKKYLTETIVGLGKSDVLKCVMRACGIEVKSRDAKPDSKSDAKPDKEESEGDDEKEEPKKEEKKKEEKKKETKKEEPKKEEKKSEKPKKEEPKKEEKKPEPKKKEEKKPSVAVSDSDD